MAFEVSTFESPSQEEPKQKIRKYKNDLTELQKRVNLNTKSGSMAGGFKGSEDNHLLQENYVLSESIRKLNQANEFTINIGNELHRNQNTMLKSLSTVG